MKIRNLLHFLGLRGRPRHYPYEVRSFILPGLGEVRYAQWMHPRESAKQLHGRLVEEYRRHICPGAFCLDIGAHTGDTTLPMALAAGPNGCVLALEPNPFVYPVLEKTARLNRHLTNIYPVMAAAGRETGFLQFEYSDSGYCNGGRHENIPAWRHGHAYPLKVRSIHLGEELKSDFPDLLPNLGFIKVDTEGYDLAVLMTLESLLAMYRPLLKVEIYKKTGLEYRRTLLTFLCDLGYEVHRIAAEPLFAGDALTLASLAPGEHYDIFALPRKSVRRRPPEPLPGGYPQAGAPPNQRARRK